MSAPEIAFLIVATSAFVLAAWFLPNAIDTIAQSATGEPASMLPRGVMPLGLRLRRAFELQTTVARLALITRLNLPLGAALEAAARNESYRRAEVFRRLSRMVDSGVPLGDALKATVRGCPDQLVAAFRRAEAIGQLPQALSELERGIEFALDVHTRSTAHVRHAMAYATLMLSILGLTLVWYIVIVVPRFLDIFRDFETSLPSITLAMVALARWFVTYGLAVLAVGVAVLLVLGLARIAERHDGGPVSRAVAALRWALPVTRSIDGGMGMAKAIRALALSIRCGTERSFADALPAVVCPTNHLRRPLERFALALAGGETPSTAARDAGLGHVFVGALRMVERGDDPQQVLGHAADYYEAMAYRWWRALTALSGPLVTLAMAALVGFMALALFTPLVALINSVAESI